MRRDTTLRIARPRGADSILLRDSGKVKAVPLPEPHDTTKAPLAHAPVPQMLPGERSLRLNRQEIFATGALTLQDLLERVGGVTAISTGYLAAPTVGTVAGDLRRVRVFVDGVEYDALDPRGRDVVDLSQIPLWMAEDATIERAALETRVHLRTWRVDRTDDYTRTDIGTGDQQTNLYRAFYGKRMQNGGALQLAAQQYSTIPPNYLGSSADQLGALTRVGWARRDLSVDGTFIRVSRNRGVILPYQRLGDSIAGVDSRRTGGYVRVGYKDPDTSRAWAQIVASPTSYNFKLPSPSSGATDTVKTDTTRSQFQVVLGAGTNRGPFGVQALVRVRRADSTTLLTPELSGSYSARGLGLRATYEGTSRDSLARASAVGEYLPMAFLRVGGAVDRIVDHNLEDLATTGLRAWAGVRVKEVWLDAGIIRRDTGLVTAPALIGTRGDSSLDSATGFTAAVEGRVWRSVYARFWGVQWTDSTGLLRPQYQARSEVFVRTNLPERFPSGNFGLLVSVRHDYRSKTWFPAGSSVLPAAGEHALTSLLEIRIATAVVSWQVRNVFGSRNYQAPDYLRPRTTNFYGVRWEFWN